MKRYSFDVQVPPAQLRHLALFHSVRHSFVWFLPCSGHITQQRLKRLGGQSGVIVAKPGANSPVPLSFQNGEFDAPSGNTWMFPKMGVPPKSSILMGFSWIFPYEPSILGSLAMQEKKVDLEPGCKCRVEGIHRDYQYINDMITHASLATPQ